jgi:hypothetical protein
MKIAIALLACLIALVVVLVLRSRKMPQEVHQKVDPKVDLGSISYSQVDMTERFGDNERLTPEGWIETVAINLREKDPEKVGLPPLGASADKVYEIAARLSKLREHFPIPSDGVYCPVCHIANIDIHRLHTPCPKCGRDLLKFGWD